MFSLLSLFTCIKEDGEYILDYIEKGSYTMLKIVVLVSGGGTNLQAIIDKIADGIVTNTKIVAVISNNANAYALERAKKAGIAAECISPKQFETRELFNEALLSGVKNMNRI